MFEARIRNCELCGKAFHYRYHNQTYCSAECANYARMVKRKERDKIKIRIAHNDPVINKALEAEAAGLSYGKYVAMTERGARYE